MDMYLAVRACLNQTVIELSRGDITQQDTDAIVNAANSSLMGGGGVDGAIHRAAGPQLLAETRTLGGCQIGDAKLSRGYNLKARFVIHAVGPIYRRDDPSAPVLLASAYRRSLEIAHTNNLERIAFPSISTGAYGYPVEQAAPTALRTVCDYVSRFDSFRLIRFVLFSPPVLSAYLSALDGLIAERDDLRRL